MVDTDLYDSREKRGRARKQTKITVNERGEVTREVL